LSCAGEAFLRDARVLFVSTEFEDFVRVGGLASVSAALPRALSACCDVRVLIPGYRAVLAAAAVAGLEMVGHCEGAALLPSCSVGRLQTKDGLTVYVVVCPELYDREGTPYVDANGHDWPDNDIRFARLAACAVDLGCGLVDPDWAADIFHANDWPSALVPAYATWRNVPTPTILTIHNLAYQGLFGRETLARIGAPDAAFDINGLEFYDKVSFLKGGIVYASHVTTVSETYAREITTPELGYGLDGLLRRRAEHCELSGILNGIDPSWNPRTCPELPRNFGAADLWARRSNTDYVRDRFDLAVAEGPLFGLVSRLVHQKGVDLVLSAAESIVSAGGQIVVTGNGEKRFEQALEQLRQRFPGSVGVARFDERDARAIFAGSDFTFMPSRFEPCGLSQMYAQRFGSLPIGYRTGGLAETIDDGRTGFLFDRPSIESFLGAVCRAFAKYSDRGGLNAMRREAMSQSYSWSEPAEAYARLYRQLAA
jgi:starch synthase